MSQCQAEKNTHSVIGPPISPVVDSVSLSVSLSDSLTGLLFLFISSVSVSAQWVVVGQVNLADQLVQNELRMQYKAWQTAIFLSLTLLFVPG